MLERLVAVPSILSFSLINITVLMGLTFKTWFRSIMTNPVISIYPHR